MVNINELQPGNYVASKNKEVFKVIECPVFNNNLELFHFSKGIYKVKLICNDKEYFGDKYPEKITKVDYKDIYPIYITNLVLKACVFDDRGENIINKNNGYKIHIWTYLAHLTLESFEKNKFFITRFNSANESGIVVIYFHQLQNECNNILHEHDRLKIREDFLIFKDFKISYEPYLHHFYQAVELS